MEFFLNFELQNEKQYAYGKIKRLLTLKLKLKRKLN